MPNNYCESSSFLKIPSEKLDKAREIVNREVQAFEDDDDGYCGCSAEVQKDGVWLYGKESVNVGHVAVIARALVEELELDEPFYCSWCYRCDKPRPDEFGGGALVIKRGFETYWVDARSMVEEQLENGMLTPLSAA